MQQIIDLENRLDQLVSDNHQLQAAKSRAEQSLEDALHGQQQSSSALSEAMQTRELHLREKDSEIQQLRESLGWLQGELARLTEMNEGLRATNDGLTSTHGERYRSLQAEHDEKQRGWEQTGREVEDLRRQNEELSQNMESIVREEIANALEDKNAEIDRLRQELETAKEQVRALQRQILEAKSAGDFLEVRDEDYFESACEGLCQHVQQWVLRFSKFSDMRGCRLVDEVRDDKIVDRLENAVLDGSDVDVYLNDRVKRRDVFMSVVMTMIWEFVFTRYLFGMDREQRQKLKSLERILSEVGE